MDFSLLHMWTQMGMVAKGVVVILLIMSMYSIGVTRRALPHASAKAGRSRSATSAPCSRWSARGRGCESRSGSTNAGGAARWRKRHRRRA